MKNSLTQYIELFEQNQNVVGQNSPIALNRLRPDALVALKNFGRLPGKRDEGFSETSLDEMFAPDLGVNISRIDFAVDVAKTFHCDVPNVSSLLGIVVNDSFRPTATLLRNCPEGVTVCSLAKAASEHPEFIEKYLGRISANRDAATALNTLFIQDGVLIHISAGCRLEKTIQIVNIFNADADILGFRRILIVVDDAASARVLVCDHSQNAEHTYVANQTVEIFLGKGSRLDYCDIEESSERTSRICQLFARQDASSTLTINGTSLMVGHTRNEYRIDLAGEHSSAEITGMAIADSQQVVDNSSFICHSVPRCHSNQLFKYLLYGQAHGAFEGSIYVAEDAVATEAYQSNRNILASDDARMHAAPQLEIYCDDVKCSHGAATGQLDNRALFYMRTRGVPEAEARMMLMQAFMTDVIDHIAIEPMRDRMRHLIERRLSGDRALCGDCRASSVPPNRCQK